MVTFEVNDMTCGHCASAISRAVAAVDASARVDVRIQQKLVQVNGKASNAELARAIQDAGYTPREVQQAPAQAVAASAKSGCGCGCGTRKAAAVDPGQQAAAPRSSCCG
jgi:copper chaperone